MINSGTSLDMDFGGMEYGSSRFIGSEDELDDFNAPRLRKLRRRILHKHGEFNVYHNHLRKRGQRFLADIFTTLVDSKWRYILFTFVTTFHLSWLLFAGFWWLISFAHGDLAEENKNNDKFIPCVTNIQSFTSSLLFSVETQHTIGYGSRYTTEECPEAIFLMMLQSCYGVVVQALMAGLVFAKLTRPKKRAETLLFSKNAAIARRNGLLCLMFRVGDMRTKSQLVDAHVRTYLIRRSHTQEGEVVPLDRHPLEVGFNSGSDRLILSWPAIIEHRIDEQSPLWELDASQLESAHFEIISFLEATIETTGMSVQARSSYVPEEIQWGHRFEPLEHFNPDSGRYAIDFDRFHVMVAVDTPRCSAKDLSLGYSPDELRKGSADAIDTPPDDELETSLRHLNVPSIHVTSSLP